MKSLVFVCLFFFTCFTNILAQEKEEAPSAPLKLDIVLVLDNSGSMKKNDPEFLTRKMVSGFLEGLSEDSRIGFVIFGEKSELAMSLTPVAEKETAGKVQKTLEKVNYKGQFTNSPAAIERAIYELKQNGRKDAERLIIFMTDGIIDTGDRARDIEKLKWLKEELAEESKKSGIRIFGIAFTDQADFELIQTLGQKTEGGYYRALKTIDIPGVFSDIRDTILKPEPVPSATTTAETKEKDLKPISESQPPVTKKVLAPTPSPSLPLSPPVKTPPENGGFSTETLIVAIVGLIVLAIVAIFFMNRKKDQEPTKAAQPEEKISVPAAMLMDLSKVTGRVSFKIDKRIIKIGRLDEDDMNLSLGIAIPQDTISAEHAQIEYRDNNFYLVDLRSSNGTYLNKDKKRITGEVRLKGGDIVGFDKYKFQFVLPGRAPKGGTVLSPAPGKGGTVLSAPQSPGAPPAPKQKPKVDKKISSSPDVSPVPQSSAPEEKGTELKQLMCPNHKSFKATELCLGCKKAYCKNCMKEKDGRMICVKCAA